MRIHVLPGDALAEQFRETKIEGEIVICRECLIEGEVKAADLKEFWQTRAAFIAEAYNKDSENYFQKVVAEFEKLQNSSVTEINLWFEHELFCQTNLWFTLSLLSDSRARIFRVAPLVGNVDETWKGFGNHGAADLKRCFAARIELHEDDLKLGADLWTAYQNKDDAALTTLSERESRAFPYLREVCRAEIEKPTRPQKVLREIEAAHAAADFPEIFKAFSQTAGVYGFGDAQVKRILAEISS